MTKIVSQSGHIAYGIKEYICDLESDISQLSISDVPGSEAFCIENGKTYILNNSHNWVVKIASSESQDISGLEKQITDLNNQVDSLNEGMVKANSQIEKLNSDLTNANNAISSLNIEISELKETNTNMNSLIVELEAEIVILKAEINKLKQDIEDITPDPEIEGETAIIPENIGVVDVNTNTLVLTDEDIKIVNNTLILN